MTFVFWTLTATSLVLVGCASMAPEYRRPEPPVPARFGDASQLGVNGAQAVASLQWHEVFLDKRLQKSISTALENNRDLRLSWLRMERLQAQYRISQADMHPALQLQTSQSASRGRTSSGEAARVNRSATLGVGVSSWELDLFGRIRSLSDEALETFLASEQAQRSARISLVAEVASTWLAVGADQARLALAEQTLLSQRKTLELMRNKYQFGIASAVDLAQVQASVQSARADVAGFTTALAQSRHALELVVGASLGESELPTVDRTLEPIRLAPPPENLSSSVLQLRPDVLAAEHELKAANADVGAARAAFFPTIALTASSGRSSDALTHLFVKGGHTWSVLPGVTVPVFNQGAIRASLDAAEIQKKIRAAEYEKSIQRAFREVADALAVRANVSEQMAAQLELVAATETRYRLSELRYRSGVNSYLETLDSQRSFYNTQQALITLQLDEANNRVVLYKVLGGGADAVAWNVDGLGQ
ncbi:efflux transporter outer membrane subunit [Variovorax sp. ZS18.2.2]|uniref:efflux transporter outer membrane subunit n=1 Tax=Variovorax sp. ZS18.2.2 TaxID=2971255 RepID=UPI0021510C97|nr:efflux transporter outer membrane subunit [Variovorax sp. ZS18.2.2]MCR6476507.1 efflux transporter outer membrane subunit [Variovorax sp. ZS18.2.2]